MFTDLTEFCVSTDSTLHQAIAQMEVNRNGVILVVEGDGKLVGVITDGDVRRAILDQFDLNEPVNLFLSSKGNSNFGYPVTASVDEERVNLLRVLQANRIRHLPLVDKYDKVVDLVTLGEFLPSEDAPSQAVIMAGGFGLRLRPLTNELPKPMLPMGDKPLMEIIVQQLRDVGIHHMNVTLHHKSEKITDYFGDGSDFGVDIRYVTEDKPLGTAGALGLMATPPGTTLVMNGDILTGMDFKAMLAYHREHVADLTVAVRQCNVQLPYGVVECDGAIVNSLSEKPVTNFLVNAGIYLLEPDVHRFIPKGNPYDMTELIQSLITEGRKVCAFPLREYWVDIGEHADYERAQQDVREGKIGK